MKRSFIIALSCIAAAIPACAQHPSGGVGHSSAGPSHTAPSFHSAPAESHYTGSSAPFGMTPARSAPTGDHRRSPERYRDTRGYNYPGVIGYVAYPYVSQPYYDDSVYASTPDVPVSVANPDPNTDPGPNTADNPNAYDPQAAANIQSPAEIVRPSERPAPPPAPEQTITLIFKDGRQPQQIQNYMATRSTITVINGQRHHDIPVADLDIPATIAANQDNGNGFQLPGATR